MSTRRAYFASGEIIEHTGGKAAFRRHVKTWQKYAVDNDRRVWFRPCDAWREADRQSRERFARSYGFTSYAAFEKLCKVVQHEDGSVDISMPFLRKKSENVVSNTDPA